MVRPAIVDEIEPVLGAKPGSLGAIKDRIKNGQALAGVFDLSGKLGPGTKAKVGAALESVYGPLRITPEDIGGGEATAEAGTAAPEAEAGEDDEGEEGPEDGAGAD